MQLVSLNAIQAAYSSSKILTEISPNDEMWVSGPAWYFSVGESGLNCILSALSNTWLSSVYKILDLPCGHGRVSRHLRAAFPGAELLACDLNTDGVDFCIEHLNATGIYSKPELCDVELPNNIDLIWVGSLFTHVDADRTMRWMKKLTGHLSPHGVIVATFHGLWSKQQHETSPLINDASWQAIKMQYDTGGYGYATYTEFDLGDYGVSLSDPSWLMKMATLIPGTRVIGYTERGWANNHDVLTITRNDRFADHP